MKLDERNAILASLSEHGCPALEKLFRDCTWVDDEELTEVKRLLDEIDELAQQNARLKASHGHLEQELAMRPER